MLDGLLHAVELGEGGVAFDDFVLEDPAQSRIIVRIGELWLADGSEQTLRGPGIGHWIDFAQFQILIQAHILLSGRFVSGLVALEDRHSGYLSRCSHSVRRRDWATLDNWSLAGV